MLSRAMVRAVPGLLIVAACAAQAAELAAGDPAPARIELPAHAEASLSILPDSCQAHWNTEPVTPGLILDRSVAMLEQAIYRIGGVENVTEDNIPWVSLDTAAETTWRCMGPSLQAVQRSGMIKLELRDTFVFFASNVHSAASEPAYFVGIGANGRIAWNGASTDLNQLRDHVRALAEEASVPDRLFLDVAPEATFLDFYFVARAIDDEGGRPTLTGCGGPMGPYRPERPACPAEPHGQRTE